MSKDNKVHTPYVHLTRPDAFARAQNRALVRATPYACDCILVKIAEISLFRILKKCI